MTGVLPPLSGQVKVSRNHVFLDQNVAVLNPSETIRDNFRRLNPAAGEKLRAALACVLGVTPPELLILDEPTNHLDIDAIAAVEAGLRAYDGALIVVSHDETFLESINIDRYITL